MSVLPSALVAAANAASSSFQTISAQQPKLINGFIPPTKYTLPQYVQAQQYVSPFSQAAYNPQCPAKAFKTYYTAPTGTRGY